MPPEKVPQTSLRPIGHAYFWPLFLIIFGVAVVLRLYNISHQSFWFDEGLSLQRTDDSTLAEVLVTLSKLRYDKYQPTYFVGLFFWRSFFGDTQIAIRSLSVVLGLGSIAITTFVAVRLFGQRHALWTAAFMSISAYHIYYSQEARAYSLVMALAALQLLLFSPLLVQGRRCSRGRIVWFWLVTTLGILSSIFLFIFTLSLCCSHWLSTRSLTPWARFWAPLLICTAPGLVFYSTSPYVYSIPYFLQKSLNIALLQNLAFVGSGLLAGVSYLAPLDQLRGPERLKVLLSYWPHLGLLLGVVAILTTAVVRQLVRDTKTALPRPYAISFLVWLIVILCLLSLLFSAATGMSWLPRHGAIIFSPIALLLPSTFCRSAESLQINAVLRKASLGATFALMLMNGLALHNYYFDPNYARDDYRSVATYVNQHADADTASILVWGNPRLLRYYGDTHTVFNGIPSRDDLPNQVSDIAGDFDRVLILVNRERSHLGYSVEDTLKDTYQLEDKVIFPGFTIYQFHTH